MSIITSPKASHGGSGFAINEVATVLLLHRKPGTHDTEDEGAAKGDA